MFPNFSGQETTLEPVRAVAQLGSALVWGTRGRGFKSRQPDWDMGYSDAGVPPAVPPINKRIVRS